MTHREISHINKELIELENDLTINDKELTWRKKHIARNYCSITHINKIVRAQYHEIQKTE
jgi:hypothetical protein